MAKVVNVVDVPELPGAGMLHFDDGRPPLMALPEIANDYRAHLGIDPIANGVAGPGSGTPDRAKAEADDRNALGSAISGAAHAVGNFFTTPRGDFVGPGAHPKPAPAPAAPSPQAAPAPQQAAPVPQGNGVPPMLARPPEQAPPTPGPDAGVRQAAAPAPPSTDDLVAQANDAARRKAADECNRSGVGLRGCA